MNVFASPGTLRALKEKMSEPQAVLRVSAMTEGCGCGANVMFEMNWDIAHRDDLRFSLGEGITVVMDRHTAAQFEPELEIHFEEDNGSFTLKNGQEIFVNHIFV